MAQVKLLFKVDHNHSHASKELVGAYTNQRLFKRDATKLITDDLQSDSGSMDYEEEKDNIKWHLEFFFEKNQTQGLNEFELIVENVELNEIF